MMKSSTLRCSFGSIHWSGLKLSLEPSPRGTWQAILAGRSETSNVSMRRAPLSPLISRRQVGSTPQASGVTMPSPVTTTRLICDSIERVQQKWKPVLRRVVIPGASTRAPTPTCLGRPWYRLRRRKPIRPQPPGLYPAARPRRRHHTSATLRDAKAKGDRTSHQFRPDGGRQLFAFFSRNLMASPTVKMVSAASSGISHPNSSSNAMTSSTVSRLSAPRSSMKLAFSVTFSASTPKCSTTIFFTRSPMSLIAATSCPLNWARSVGAPEPLRYGLRGCPASDHRVASGPRCDDWNRCAAPAKPKLGYHTSKALTSAAKPHQGPAGLPQSHSNHRHPTVDVKRLPGDVSRLVRREIYRRGGHVGPCAQPPRRHAGEDGVPLLVVELGGHGAGDEPGRDCVRRDPAFCIFTGDRLDHADHAGLGRGVIALPGIPGHTDHGRDADDAAKATPHHAPHRRPREAERRSQIDCNHLVPVFIPQLDQKIVFGDARIGHQDVELTHGLLGFRHQPLDFILVCQVARQHVDPVLEFASKLIEHVPPCAGDRDGCALLVKRPRDRASDPAGRSGDEGGLAGQIEHCSVPSLRLGCGGKPRWRWSRLSLNAFSGRGPGCFRDPPIDRHTATG